LARIFLAAKDDHAEIGCVYMGTLQISVILMTFPIVDKTLISTACFLLNNMIICLSSPETIVEKTNADT
jgi:hypothetical protein